MAETIFDMLVIGAGPTGLACAIEAQRAGMKAACVDKGCLVNSLFHYPANMTFFTTPELLEIGDIPFPSAHTKPTREEALEYYRKVAAHYELQVRQYELVAKISGSDGRFTVTTTDRHDRITNYHARKLAIATGYYDLANHLGVPGEDLPKVMHYYKEPHPYYNMDVVVVGGKNSAAIAALELYRHGARVTLVHRGESMHPHVKYWIKPDIDNRLKAGEIKSFFKSSVKEILPESIVLNTPEASERSCAIANVGIEGVPPAELAKTLFDRYRIFTVAIDGAGVRGVRVTPQVLTTTAELDALVNALNDLAS